MTPIINDRARLLCRRARLRCKAILRLCGGTERSGGDSGRLQRAAGHKKAGVKAAPAFAAAENGHTISVSSGRYVCLQPKCSILLSYFFPR